MKTETESRGYPAILSVVWLIAAASGLVLLACDRQEETKVVPAIDPPASGVNVPVRPSVEPPVADTPKVEEPETVEEPVAETPNEIDEIDESREFIYVDEMTGEERKMPIEFKSYPEWGPYRYADQVVRHNREQIKLNAGDPAKVKEFSAKIEEFTAMKADAYQEMERRLSEAPPK